MEISALSIGSTNSTISDKQPIYEAWEAVIADFSSNAPPGLQTVYQEASLHWAWMESERALFMNTIKGMLGSLCFACIVVFLATGNWIVTLYAIHAVGFICAGELALLKMQGSDLGISESIGILMAIGYSVNYVVRLALVYIQSS